MKNEFKPKYAEKEFCIPDEIVDGTSLGKAETVDAYSNSGSILLLDRYMTAKQIIHTVDMLNTVATGLIMRLERAAMLHEEQCRRISIPEELLEMASIPKDAVLDICAGEGELYISVAANEDDVKEILPSFLCELFSECELDLNTMRYLLNSEEPIHE